MDVKGVTYERFEELVLYCRRVAGAIGRVCLAIFGARDDSSTAGPRPKRWPTTSAWRCSSRTSCATCARTPRTGACTCRPRTCERFGWSRISRALRAGRGSPALRPECRARWAECARGARITAPRRRSHGRRGADGDEVEWLHALVRFEADRARQWFERGMELAPLLDRRSAACVLAMAGIYRRLLERIEADPSGRCASACRCRRPRRRGWRPAACSVGRS